MLDLATILKYELKDAEEEAVDSHDLAMNSYGAGYDRGYVDWLKTALEYVEDNV